MKKATEFVRIQIIELERSYGGSGNCFYHSNLRSTNGFPLQLEPNFSQ